MTSEPVSPTHVGIEGRGRWKVWGRSRRSRGRTRDQPVGRTWRSMTQRALDRHLGEDPKQARDQGHLHASPAQDSRRGRARLCWTRPRQGVGRPSFRGLFFEIPPVFPTSRPGILEIALTTPPVHRPRPATPSRASDGRTLSGSRAFPTQHGRHRAPSFEDLGPERVPPRAHTSPVGDATAR